MFPPNFTNAVKISLLNEPIYHGQLTQASVCDKIQNDGDFLVQDGCDSQSLLLSVFKGGVRNFLITIEEVEDGVRFRVGTNHFASLNDLTFQMKTVQIGLEIIQLGTAIYRIDNCGRFGAQCVIEEPPRCSLSTIIPLTIAKYKSVVVPLKKEIIHEGIEEELESLILLKHRRLVPLLDFASYGHGLIILRYENHDSVSLYDHLRKNFRAEQTQTLRWIRQAASLTYYLVQKNCFHSILCAQDCYLDVAHNMKFRGAWNNSWSNWQEDTLKQAFYWRFVAPESLFYDTHDCSSVIWNLGVFMWQLCTQCLQTPFSQHRSRQSYIDAVSSGKLRLVDERSPSQKTQSKVVPQCIESLISSCIALEPERRCLWSSILNITKRESVVASIGTSVKRVFQFI